MPRDPGQCLIDRWNCKPFRDRRSLYHIDRQLQPTRGIDFRVGCVPAGVLREHARDPMFTKQSDIVFRTEWAACRNDDCIRKLRRQGDWIDNADDVAMLWPCAKQRDRRSAESREYGAWHIGQCRDGSLDCGVLAPIVARSSLPGRPLNREQRHVDFGASGDGIVADLRRERVGGVDDEIDGFARQIASEAIDAAEASDTNRHRTRRSLACPSRERKNRRDARPTRQFLRETRSFARPSEQQNVEWPLLRRVHDESPMP